MQPGSANCTLILGGCCQRAWVGHYRMLAAASPCRLVLIQEPQIGPAFTVAQLTLL